MWQTISRCCAILSLSLIGACAGTGSAESARTSTAPSVAMEAQAPTGQAPTGKGMRIYKDPVTGEFKEPPPEAAQRFQVPSQKAVESREPLVVKPSAVSGGGVEVDVRGRFLSYSKATKDADGKISIHCDPVAPETQSPDRSPTH